MRVHHLNCATMRPPSARLMHGQGGWLEPARLVAHVLLIEHPKGLILIDAGLGLDDCAHPKRLGGLFLALVRPVLDPTETARRQIEALGFHARDVRHIVLTHLDVDHAGGLADFPHAQVHVHRREHEAATRPHLRERERYRPCQWAHGPDWVFHDDGGDTFMGLEAVRAVEEPDVLLVPTVGHSRGHTCVAVRTPDGWLLHGGDAYFHRHEIATPPQCPPGLTAFQAAVAADNQARLHNQKRLRALNTRRDVEIFSAHDAVELARYGPDTVDR